MNSSKDMVDKEYSKDYSSLYWLVFRKWKIIWSSIDGKWNKFSVEYVEIDCMNKRTFSTFEIVKIIAYSNSDNYKYHVGSYNVRAMSEACENREWKDVVKFIEIRESDESYL